MKSENPMDVIASAHDVLDLLPADPTEAEATLTMAEQALAHPGKQPDRWSGPASYICVQLLAQEVAGKCGGDHRRSA